MNAYGPSSLSLPNNHHNYMHEKQKTNVENDYVNIHTIILNMTNIMNFLQVT